ncbi:hypothetical protein GR268_46315, partial [Rhizobium leguminosarum]|nr:hypothetical protein [Rhizobium leguminosarum]
ARKIEGIANGTYGYEENHVAAAVFNEHLVEQGNQKAIEQKLAVLANVRYNFKPHATQLKRWIENEASKRKRCACYLKAQGLKYGILGFQKDRKAATEYILENNIPY